LHNEAPVYFVRFLFPNNDRFYISVPLQKSLEEAHLIYGRFQGRAAFLDDLAEAFQKNSNLSNILLDASIAEKVRSLEKSIRSLVAEAALSGLPVPGHMAALSYFDAYRSEHLPTNLIQAQRDYFGAHTYQRTDMTGSFHTEWKQTKP
jgi:6-phosphogluconate dehydrogenase